MPSTEITTPIKEFIAENFLFREDRESIPENESLIETNIIDSTGVLEMVSFLEQQFGISIADTEIVPENLDSIAAITAYVSRKRTEMAA